MLLWDDLAYFLHAWFIVLVLHECCLTYGRLVVHCHHVALLDVILIRVCLLQVNMVEWWIDPLLLLGCHVPHRHVLHIICTFMIRHLLADHRTVSS